MESCNYLINLLYNNVMQYTIIFLNIFIELYLNVLYTFSKGVDNMIKRVTFSLDEDLVRRLKKFSQETMIPQSKIVEKGIESIISKNND